MRRVIGLALLALVLVGLWLRWRAGQHEIGSDVPSTQAAPPSATRSADEADVTRPAANVAESSQRAPVEVATSDAARLAGRLIDEESEESVPWYELELVASDRSRVRLTSDAGGRFTTPDPLLFGRVQCWLLDDGARHRAAVTLEHGASAGVHEVLVRAGPTYFVQVAMPEGLGLADLRARLLQDPPEFDDDRKVPETFVRDPEGAWAFPWLRFPESVHGTPLWLELASEDGLRSGGARVPGGPGVHADPVHIELAPRCAVHGRLVCPGNERDSGVLALLQPVPEQPRWGNFAAKGLFRFADLAPGEYRLEIRDEAARGEPLTFVLREGELDLGDIPCTPIPIAGSVRLRVQSEIEAPIDVQLVRLFDPPRHPLWHSDSWASLPEGGFESLFEWDEVYAGKYEIAVHSHDHGDWHVSLGELEPPVDDLTLRLPSPPPSLRLDVVDAASGAAIADWTVLVREERHWAEPDGARESLALMDPAVPFAVCSPGYRAWVGSGATIPPPPDGEDRVTIRLERGWSRLFVARKRSRGQAVPGVEIRLDGAPAGTTDARGELWVHADYPATRLEVSHPDLVWANEEEVALDELVAWIRLRP